MKNIHRLVWLLPATILSIGLRAPIAVRAQGYQSGSISARNHGYEHGYRDGYASGRLPVLSNRDQDIRNQQLKAQENGYQPSFGSELEYGEGYQQGFSDGAADSRNGNQSKLEQLFSPQVPGYSADRNRRDSSAGVYRQNHWPDDHIAQDIGYRDGVNAGLQDRRARRSYQAHQHAAWKDGLHGYDATSQLSRASYRMAYRVAYEDGYHAGFGADR